MRLFVSLVGLVLVAIALMLLGADLMTTLEHQGRITTRSVEDVWAVFDKGSVDAFKAWIGAHLPGFLASVVYWSLSLWSWAVAGGLGIVLVFLFGRKQETGE